MNKKVCFEIELENLYDYDGLVNEVESQIKDKIKLLFDDKMEVDTYDYRFSVSVDITEKTKD